MSIIGKVNRLIIGHHKSVLTIWVRFCSQSVSHSSFPSDQDHKKNRNYFLHTTPYQKLNKEEREYLTSGIYQKSVILGIPEFDNKKIQNLKPKIDPNLEPFRQIYQDTEDNENFTQAEVVAKKDSELWNWVERLLPKEDKATYIKLDDKEYPSGYVPPSKVPPNLAYFVSRTRGGLFPVYKTVEKTNRVLTLLNKIDGDIWKAAQSLKNFLEKRLNKKIIMSVNEPKKRITLKNDHVFSVIEWLKSKGF